MFGSCGLLILRNGLLKRTNVRASKIVDLPKHTFIVIDDEKVLAEFDPRQGSEDKLSSVQYIKFKLNGDQSSKFNDDNSKIYFGFDHPNYSHQHELNSDQKKVLFSDMQ